MTSSNTSWCVLVWAGLAHGNRSSTCSAAPPAAAAAATADAGGGGGAGCTYTDTGDNL